MYLKCKKGVRKNEQNKYIFTKKIFLTITNLTIFFIKTRI